MSAALGALAQVGLPMIQELFTETQALGSPSDVQNINPDTEMYRNLLMGNLNRFQQGMDQYSDLFGQYRGQQGNLINQITGFQPTAQYDSQAGMRQFLSNNPALQGVIDQSLGGTPEDIVRQAQSNALQQVNASLAPELRGSSAYLGAMSQGLASPLLQLSQTEQANRAQLANNLLGQNMGLSYQNAQNQYAAQRASDEMALAQLSQGLSGYQNLGNQALGMFGNYGNLYGSAQQGLGMLAAPEYWQPTYSDKVNYKDILTGGWFSGGGFNPISGLTAGLFGR